MKEIKWYCWKNPIIISDKRKRKQMDKQWILEFIPVFKTKELAEQNWWYLIEVDLLIN